jgi:alpha-L-rhamnosidase
MISVSDPICEYGQHPVIPTAEIPRFSWKIVSDKSGLMQRSYRIQTAEDELFSRIVWDSGETVSEESQFLPCQCKTLLPGMRYFWRVRVTASSIVRGGLGFNGSDQEEALESGWSELSWFYTSPQTGPWSASFITRPVEHTEEGRPICLRHEFFLDKIPETAWISSTALGLYELRLNGRRVGDDLLRPGWTSYQKRLAYQSYAVENLLEKGSNVISAILSDGWYAGNLTWLNLRGIYGTQPAFSMQLHGIDRNGQTLLLSTGSEGWKTAYGPLLSAQLYHGELYDARIDISGWDLSGYDDSGWIPAAIAEYNGEALVPQDGPSVVRQERLPVRKQMVSPRNEQILDFGQNLTGWVSFRVKGRAGERITLKHAEILDREGNFYTENMRSARNTITYILKGDPENPEADGNYEYFEPNFSFQGFRYVMIDEFPAAGQILPEDFTAQVIHSDMTRTLEFSCSHDLLNSLQHNILWGWKGNSVDVPTDCPQRDERLGWTGDAQIFIGTAVSLMDINAFFRKWLRDLAAEQRDDGGVPFVIPDVLTPATRLRETDILESTHSSTGWGDAAVVCPWTLYATYGDEQLLAEQYPTMKGWIRYISERAPDGIWEEGFHFADWVALDAEEGSYFGATPAALAATAYYAYSVQLTGRAAAVLKKPEEAEQYFHLHRSICTAFRKHFFREDGRLHTPTQTGYVLALVLDLSPDESRNVSADELVRLIRENGGHITTGFLGTPWICRALSENGYRNEAFRLLLQEDFPSWLFQVKMGATTVWEHWDGMKTDGTVWSAAMNSFNHYAYGAVGEWIFKEIGGLSPGPAKISSDFRVEQAPGWRHAVYAIEPGGGLTYSSMAYESRYGRHELIWRIDGDRVIADITIPPNTTGVVTVPLSARSVSIVPELSLTVEGSYQAAAAGSGTYRVSYGVSLVSDTGPL